ncbi:NAC domain [Macleaya cordata]|uniref:NAC domain n=1 Tax=Macleaya cordata TaxID=56857 RepID=A0A200Q9M6_MACCD|nr:NAC domain [Macleaya cordata]
MEFSTRFPGFRFSPTDVELISHYLKRKIQGLENCDDVIPEVDICKFEPWDLPAKSIIKSDHEWFFFSPSGRKYPNGSQARRATEVGFWKATGKERGIKSGSNVIGTKRTLVFHLGRAPKGERTEWIMHEYCIKRNKTDGCQDPFVVCRIRRKLDDSVKNDSQNGESGSNANSSNTNTDLCAGAQVGLDIQHSQTSASGKDKAMDCSSKNQMTGLDSLSTDKPDESEINHEDQALESEDDCFADILKDDIVKLDDTTPYSKPLESSIVAEKPGTHRNSNQSGLSVMLQTNPLQGIAQRRIRLEMQRSNAKTIRVRNKGSVASIIQQETKRPTKSLKSKISFYTVNSGLIFTVLILMSLAVSFLLMLIRGTRHFESFENLSTPNSKRHDRET